MYLLGMMVITFILVIFKFVYEYERFNITYDNIDDALVASLISACTYNTSEYSLSGAAVIYDTVTPVRLPDVLGQIAGLPADTTPHDTINDVSLYAPAENGYLDNCYQVFLKNLKHNLKLGDDMSVTVSGLDGVVTVREFSIYNKFYNIDEDGNKTDFRIVKYTRLAAGGWNIYPYGINQAATAYNSLDHADSAITETSVSAQLEFQIRTNDYVDWLMPSKTEADMLQTVQYQRIVDITSN